MSLVQIDSTKLTAIANAIRTKLGLTSSDIMTPKQMSANILKTPTSFLAKLVNGTETAAELETFFNVVGFVPMLICYNVTSLSGNITIPNNVTSIMKSAFIGCTGLTGLTIGSGVQDIGETAFSGCTGLTSSTIPSNVTAIGYRAFRGCSSLTSLIISGSSVTFGGYAFQNCTNLTSVKTNSLPSTSSQPFSGCSSLHTAGPLNGNYDYEFSATELPDSCFFGLGQLTSIVIPNTVTKIGNSALASCTGLSSITIPNSVTSIGNNAFGGCSGLTNINIPDSVTTIQQTAFSSCTGLTKIFIPSTVSSLGSPTSPQIMFSPFYQCSSTLEIYTDALSRPSGWNVNFDKYEANGRLTVHYGITRAEYEAL